MFFDPRRYDLAKVGRYKFNKKLHLINVLQVTDWQKMLLILLQEKSWQKQVLSDRELAEPIQNAAVPLCMDPDRREENVKVLSNMMVDLTAM